MYRTPVARRIPCNTSSASAIAGTHFGLTNATPSHSGNVQTRACSQRRPATVSIASAMVKSKLIAATADQLPVTYFS